MTIQDIYVYSEPIHNAHFYMHQVMYYVQLVAFYVQPKYVAVVVNSALITKIGKASKSFMSARRAQ
jgi:hypothetical protein